MSKLEPTRRIVPAAGAASTLGIDAVLAQASTDPKAFIDQARRPTADRSRPAPATRRHWRSLRELDRDHRSGVGDCATRPGTGVVRRARARCDDDRRDPHPSRDRRWVAAADAGARSGSAAIAWARRDQFW